MGVLNDRMTPPTEVHRDVMRDAGSRENIELVREHVEAYVRRDVEAMRRVSNADLELDWSASKGGLPMSTAASRRSCGSTRTITRTLSRS